jgi:hypothetical protein
MMKRSASREKDSRISFRRLPHLARKSLDGAAIALDAAYAARLAPGAPRVNLWIAFSLKAGEVHYSIKQMNGEAP